MVQKTSHRGVYSGNTLRAFNSRFSRHYHKQACIVSRVHPELLQKLQAQERTQQVPAAINKNDKKWDDGNKDKKKKPTEPQHSNAAVNVALSLNKQARWLLPSALIQQVRTNDIADSELTVSVLERHKLKRPANCVSFHSNKGEVKRIQAPNGRYFGFQFPRADGKSKRTMRRERREKLLESMKANRVKQMVGKKVEVFTEQGRARRDLEMGESEVRYEVFYPTPASSSIAHNPKYIKQWTDPDDPTSGGAAGDDEHVQHGKPRKRHRGKRRTRMTLKDVDDWELAASRYPHSDTHKTLTTISHTVDPDQFSLLRDAREEPSAPARSGTAAECLLSSLIEKAQRLRNFKGSAKPHCKKNRTSSKVDDDDNGKPHLVFLNDKSQEDFVQNQTSHGKSDGSSPSLHPASPMPSECTRVLLPKDDVSSTSLKERFGQCYIEGGCQPRKFILDVTADVREVLKKEGIQARVAEQTEEALSYLICIHDGFYDDDYDVYRVFLNSKLHEGLLSVEISSQDSRDLFRGTVMSLTGQTMDFMQGLVADLKEKKHFPPFLQGHRVLTSPRHLSHHLGSSEAYVPSVKRVFQLESTVSDVTTAAPATLSDLVRDHAEEEPVFCDVCYDDISPLTHGSAPYTSLLTCRHRVCDSCWSQHIHVRLHEGFVRVTCPGYDCQQEVKVGVLLSVAPMDTVEKLLQRQEEVRIGASRTEKWCPNETCGRVISLKTPASSSSSSSSAVAVSASSLQIQQDVVCACGTHVCFQCLMPAHWPASCKQAEDYRATVATAGAFPDRLSEIHDDFEAERLAREKRKLQEKQTMLVEGKHCPRCQSFVNKNGGCPQMTCRCGQLFCWYCAKPGYSHPDRRFCVSEQVERKLTTTIVVHHLEQEKDSEQQQQRQSSSPSSGNRRQRMSLMERAAEHRRHRERNQNSRAIATLAKAVATAAAKNKLLSQSLAAACSGGGAFPASSSSSSSSSPSSSSSSLSSSSSSSSSSSPSTSFTMLAMASAFLKNADRSQHELLEVVEYSLVLLKDLPDSLLRRRALRISEDLSAFCSFSQSVFDVWSKAEACRQGMPLQEAVKALMRLVEIQDWVSAALGAHVATVKKLRGLHSPAAQQ